MSGNDNFQPTLWHVAGLAFVWGLVTSYDATNRVQDIPSQADFLSVASTSFSNLPLISTKDSDLHISMRQECIKWQRRNYNDDLVWFGTTLSNEQFRNFCRELKNRNFFRTSAESFQERLTQG